MTPESGRRTFLKSALAAAGAALLPRFSAAGSYSTTVLTDRITLITGPSGANIVALSGAGGLVLVDSGAPESADDLPGALPDGIVRTVFNTHYHLDQTGGNAALAAAGAAIIAHARTRKWMSAPIWVPHLLSYTEARPADALPTQTFYTEGRTTHDAETIDYGYLVHAHTDGDIYVFFREANVLAVGDLASPDRDPVFDWFAGGWLGGRVDAQAALLELADENTRIVPAYGPVMSRAEFAAEHELLSTLYQRVHGLFIKGRSAADFITEGALDGLPRRFENPDKLMYDIHKGLWGHQDALAHEIV